MSALSFQFTRQVYELGPVPTGSEIHAYYAKLLEMDREFARTMAKWWSPGGVWDPSRFRNNPIAPALSFSTSWKKYMGQSAYNHRRLRLHRRFQAHGVSVAAYSDQSRSGCFRTKAE